VRLTQGPINWSVNHCRLKPLRPVSVWLFLESMADSPVGMGDEPMDCMTVEWCSSVAVEFLGDRRCLSFSWGMKPCLTPPTWRKRLMTAVTKSRVNVCECEISKYVLLCGNWRNIYISMYAKLWPHSVMISGHPNAPGQPRIKCAIFAGDLSSDSCTWLACTKTVLFRGPFFEFTHSSTT
jgi:hypothetical protein